jgi:hypothetical protein
VLGEDLSLLPGGAAAVLGQLIHGPPTEGWLVDRRREIADVCCYAMEGEFARAQGRQDAVQVIDQYVNALAEKLLVELGEHRTQVTAVGGFDGGDPDPKPD